MKRVFTLALTAVLLCFCLPGSGLADIEILSRTTLSGVSDEQLANLITAAEAVDGIELMRGDSFSFAVAIGERTAENGYVLAESGDGELRMGGGVEQLATGLYQLIGDEYNFNITEMAVYGSEFVGEYIGGQEAIRVEEELGYDFSFRSYYEGSVTLSVWIEPEECVVGMTLREASVQEGEMTCLGYGLTPVGGTPDKINNIQLALGSINPVVLRSGDQFSFNAIVGDRTKANGYLLAPNGRGVEVVGGGVAQVASTVWLAVKDMEGIVVDEKRSYGSRYTDNYVAKAEDAIMIDWSSGLDFAFTWTGEQPLVIYAYMDGEYIVCEAYSGE